ncbi:MAG: 3-oxoacyl-[acyl-carrier-protein] synthase II [Flavobacteriales bacterium]|jgi:3-oxoacyl-[acyl-carrier-protein] synthase II
MRRRVFVTSTGAISAVGNSVAEQLDRLWSASPGLDQPLHLKTVHRSVFVGEVKLSNDELQELTGVDNKYPSRASMLACHAAMEAMEGIDKPIGKWAVVSGNTGGGMTLTEQHYKSYFKTETPKEDFDTIQSHHAGDSTDAIRAMFSNSGFNATISTACSSSANAIMFAARLISIGQIDAAIAGGVDSLSAFTLNGFRSLRIMEDQRCRPFDKNRVGLNLGEAAAFVVLESEESAAKHGRKILCELTGWANANDAFHETATSPNGEGAKLAMEQALKVAKLTASDIGYINAHGTGTENNDHTEAQAITRIFGENVPPISSTKGYTGHTLGAAGSLEAVYAIHAMLAGKTFANAGLNENDPEIKWTPETKARTVEIKHTMSNSFGFGGNATSLIFSK